MKRILIIFILSAASLLAALPSTAVWEVRSGGATASGGGFNPSNANMLTDATATSATGNAAVISSASYSFVAGDVGAWVYVKAGTNWLPGWYKISSVAANAATVDSTLGHGVTLTNGLFAVTTVAGVASTASPTGGTFGVDYSQQNAAKLSLTDLTSTGGSSNLTSVTGGFTPVMAGNILHITTTGTGAHFVIGFYEIVSVTNTNSVVTDRTTNDATAGVAGTGATGGGLAAPIDIGSSTIGAVAGNYIFVNGSFSRGGTSDTMACAGSTTAPVKVIGYGTYRGDAYLGRSVTTTGKLITTNMPTLTYTGSARYNASGASVISECLNIVGAATTSSVLTSGTTGIVISCVATNSSTNASAQAISAESNVAIIDCDGFMTGATGGSAVLSIGNNNIGKFIGNRLEVTTSTTCGVITSAGAAIILNNVLIAKGGVGIASTFTTQQGVIWGNTITGASDAINVVTATTSPQCIGMNMLTDNSGYGINMVSTTNFGLIYYNRTRANTSGAINSGTGWVNAASYGEVTTGSSSDYVNSATGDYRLIAASPAAGAGYPKYGSMGALQRDASASAGGQRSYSR